MVHDSISGLIVLVVGLWGLSRTILAIRFKQLILLVVKLLIFVFNRPIPVVLIVNLNTLIVRQDYYKNVLYKVLANMYC